MNTNDKIYVAGHRGMVGSAIVRKLEKEGYNNIVSRTSRELDLRVQQDVEGFFASEKPDYVILLPWNLKTPKPFLVFWSGKIVSA